MGVQWIGGENGYPMVSVDYALLTHGDVVSALVACSWNLSGDNWSEYDVRRLEAAVAEIRKRFALDRAARGQKGLPQ